MSERAKGVVVGERASSVGGVLPTPPLRPTARSVAPHFCIVTEYVSRGSVWNLLHDPPPPPSADDRSGGVVVPPAPAPLPLPLVLRMALDVARGMAYLHSGCVPRCTGVTWDRVCERRAANPRLPSRARAAATRSCTAT